MRVLAFYLPQFHPIPENDEWWGKGFTEWRNVVQGRPLFQGHYQPHLPADLGFYDLRVPETRERQSELARAHGVSGFCYYHYWFNGRRLLNRPFEEVLKLKAPRFPFCLCWANENWTRRWDGLERDVLLSQHYSSADDRAHIRHLLPAFSDDRYIRIDGKPLFLVYHTQALPDPARTAEIWRAEARAAGFNDLYLATVESHAGAHDPRPLGFDASVEFAPNWRYLGPPAFQRARYDLIARIYRRLRGFGVIPDAYFDNRIFEFDDVKNTMLAAVRPEYPWLRCVMPSWDNSPRRRTWATIVRGSTPAKYEEWLRAAIADTLRVADSAHHIVFVNAWNEWAEGNHLEPDLRWGRAYLEATRRAILADPGPGRDVETLPAEAGRQAP